MLPPKKGILVGFEAESRGGPTLAKVVRTREKD